MNIFLENDEEEEKKKKDEDKDEEEDDEEKTGNDYLGDGDDSDDDHDSDDDNDESDEDDYSSYSDDEDDYKGSGNDYLDSDSSDDSSDDTGSSGSLINLTYALVIAANNFKHIHLMCSGKKFDRIHKIAEELYSLTDDMVDTVAEIALEDESAEIDNFCNAAEHCSDIEVCTDNNYDFESACNAMASTLNALIQTMCSTRSSCEDCPDIQSELDNYIRSLNKQNNFLMKRRMKNFDEASFITTVELE